MTFLSDYYTPDIKVSYLSTLVVKLLRTSNNFEDYDSPIDTSLIGMLTSSNLQYEYPKLYLLSRVICLESFSLSYAVANEDTSDYLQYCTVDMVRQDIQNINYLVGELQDLEDHNKDEDYSSIIKSLQDLAISIGYLVGAINAYNNAKGLGAYSNG